MNNQKEPINEYKEPQMMTREFLEDLARRGKENVAALNIALKELFDELDITDKNLTRLIV